LSYPLCAAGCIEDAVRRLISEKPDGLLDEVFELFRQELALAYPDYAAGIGLALATVEDIADRYFRARQEADPFVWAARNQAEAKHNKANRITFRAHCVAPYIGLKYTAAETRVPISGAPSGADIIATF
jgi:hypothetical protein